MQQAARVSDTTAFFYLGRARGSGRRPIVSSPVLASRAPRPTSPGDSDELRIDENATGFDTSTSSSSSSSSACSTCRSARSRCVDRRRRCAAAPRRRQGRRRHQRRPRARRARGRDRAARDVAARAAAADGARSPLHHQRDQDLERPRARRRPRGEHRAVRAAPESTMRSIITPDPEIEDMARRARLHARRLRSTRSFAPTACWVAMCAARDDQVDALHDSLFRILLTHMLEDPTTISAALELFLVSRNLERVADLATNIAEDAVYLAEGKSIKHHLEDRSLAPARSASRPWPNGGRRRTGRPRFDPAIAAPRRVRPTGERTASPRSTSDRIRSARSSPTSPPTATSGSSMR